MAKYKFLIILLSCFVLIGCATISYLPSASRTFAPTTFVEILWEKPQNRSYIILGQIGAESSDFSEETLLKKIKQRAMKIGADAIIMTSTKVYQEPAGSWFEGSGFLFSSSAHRIEGLAIKWNEGKINPTEQPVN